MHTFARDRSRYSGPRVNYINHICKRLRLRVLNVRNWRIQNSHKRHPFICHVKIYALSAVYANLINLIHASKQSACRQTHTQFAAVL